MCARESWGRRWSCFLLGCCFIVAFGYSFIIVLFIVPAVINLLLCGLQLLIPCFTPCQPLSEVGSGWVLELAVQEHPPKLVALAKGDSGQHSMGEGDSEFGVWNLEYGLDLHSWGELKSCWRGLWIEQTSCSEAGQGLWQGSAETRPYV